MQKLQCSCCGGKLTMQADGVAVCQFCGMEYTPDAVQKMIVELQGSVQVEGVDTADILFKRGETFFSLGDRGKAWDIFSKMSNLYPDDYRGWWGLTRLLDWDNYFRGIAGQKQEMPVVCQRAMRFAPEGKQAEIRSFYEQKAAEIGSRVNTNYANVQQQVAALREQYKQKQNCIKSLEDQILQAEKGIQKLNKYYKEQKVVKISQHL